jgi:hypothetical protein
VGQSASAGAEADYRREKMTLGPTWVTVRIAFGNVLRQAMVYGAGLEIRRGPYRPISRRRFVEAFQRVAPTGNAVRCRLVVAYTVVFGSKLGSKMSATLTSHRTQTGVIGLLTMGSRVRVPPRSPLILKVFLAFYGSSDRLKLALGYRLG